MKRQIELGTFAFGEEFPDYRFQQRLDEVAKAQSLNDVFDEFLTSMRRGHRAWWSRTSRRSDAR